MPCCGQSSNAGRSARNQSAKPQKVVAQPSAAEIMATSTASQIIRQNSATTRHYNTLNQRRQIYK